MIILYLQQFHISITDNIHEPTGNWGCNLLLFAEIIEIWCSDGLYTENSLSWAVELWKQIKWMLIWIQIKFVFVSATRWHGELQRNLGRLDYWNCLQSKGSLVLLIAVTQTDMSFSWFCMYQSHYCKVKSQQLLIFLVILGMYSQQKCMLWKNYCSIKIVRFKIRKNVPPVSADCH